MIATRHMQRAAVDGVELEYELRGHGAPVVLIHWGVCAAWAEPLMRAPRLAAQHRLLHYHRAGFAASDRIEGDVSLSRHAEHCARLMQHLGIERAHVVGHSSSADIALQLALDHPRAVHTLALMEPARPVPETDEQAAFVRDVVMPAVQRYRAGDKAAAVDTWARGVFGPDYRDALERELPGALDQAVADADAFFGQELPALREWSFTREDARSITQPVLAVRGEHTAPSFAQRLELLVAWLPDVQLCEVPGATHLLHVQDPAGVADALAAFYARHPIM
jgi:3-oxoadipate enol-lactonase